MCPHRVYLGVDTKQDLNKVFDLLRQQSLLLLTSEVLQQSPPWIHSVVSKALQSTVDHYLLHQPHCKEP